MGSTVSRSDNSCVIPRLPEEIIRGEILTRLPVKLLVRFRCVCKSWNNLLSGDPDFVKSHLNNNNNTSSSLIIRCTPYVRYRTFHPLKSMELQLAGSINGLVCVYHKFLGPLSCLGIWNPATNQYKDIPLPPPVKAFNHSAIFQVKLGFGFDHIVNDYKVLYIRNTRDRPLVGLVYSCNAASWGTTSFTSTFLARGELFLWPTIVHGCPYWYNCVGLQEHRYVMYFDFKDEGFKLLPDIEFVNQSTIQRDMVNLRDSLAFIVYEMPETSTRSVDVYVFDERCGLWSKNYTVGPITLPRSMKFLNCFWNGDLLFHSDKYLKLVSVDPETHAIDRLKSGIYVYDSSHCSLFMSYSFTYIESLASVKGMHLMHVRKVGTDLMIIEQSS